jgi:hypothetical protein
VDPAHRRSYLAVLGGALACYAALGAVLRLLPHLALGSELLGLTVGAPALTAVLARPLGARRSRTASAPRGRSSRSSPRR